MSEYQFLCLLSDASVSQKSLPSASHIPAAHLRTAPGGAWGEGELSPCVRNLTLTPSSQCVTPALACVLGVCWLAGQGRVASCPPAPAHRSRWVTPAVCGPRARPGALGGPWTPSHWALSLPAAFSTPLTRLPDCFSIVFHLPKECLPPVSLYFYWGIMARDLVLLSGGQYND